jgi:phosphoribosylglycinamide formyltransferase-1
MLKIAVLISGGGSNLQAIIDKIKKGYINAKIEVVISDRIGVYGIERAKNESIPAYELNRKELKGNLSNEILKLIDGKVDLIVLAGFLSILQGEILEKFKNKIINIHPSLMPSFCGAGMYGIKVHEKAIEYGVKVSGCTVHFVDEGIDTGTIIFQNSVPVYEGDTAEALQARVLVEEHKILPKTVKLISEGKLKYNNRKVIVE